MSSNLGDHSAVTNAREAALSETIANAIHKVAPGTPIREGIEQIIQGGTGALIVCGDRSALTPLRSGGVSLDVEFSPTLIYQLAKMDGAIVCDADAGRILGANVQLNPDPTIASVETGTRHRTADRVARQTGALAIAVSERREAITLYIEGESHHMADISNLLTKANQGLATLDRYRERFDRVVQRLAAAESEGRATIKDALLALQRAELATRVSRLVSDLVIELGTEGRMIELQLEEATHDLLAQRTRIAAEWAADNSTKDGVHQALNTMGKLSDADVLEISAMARALGYGLGALESGKPNQTSEASDASTYTRN